MARNSTLWTACRWKVNSIEEGSLNFKTLSEYYYINTIVKMRSKPDKRLYTSIFMFSIYTMLVVNIYNAKTTKANKNTIKILNIFLISSNIFYYCSSFKENNENATRRNFPFIYLKFLQIINMYVTLDKQYYTSRYSTQNIE